MAAAAPTRPEELVPYGWEIAQTTLASAHSESRLVTHWFLAPGDDGVNADDHFGSDERTLAFLGVALPTLIAQLGASAAVVALPWGLESTTPTLTVVGIGFGAPAAVQTRVLARLRAQPAAPPFWRLESSVVAPPPELVAVASGLVS